MDVNTFLQDGLVLDLEVGRDGAICNGETFERKGFSDIRRALAELDVFARPACYLFDHNLLCHDLPILHSQAPDLQLIHKPVIDTLFLSPQELIDNKAQRPDNLW
jgi:ATP-dependent DNA helicase RecQ